MTLPVVGCLCVALLVRLGSKRVDHNERFRLLRTAILLFTYPASIVSGLFTTIVVPRFLIFIAMAT